MHHQNVPLQNAPSKRTLLTSFQRSLAEPPHKKRSKEYVLMVHFLVVRFDGASGACQGKGESEVPEGSVFFLKIPGGGGFSHDGGGGEGPGGCVRGILGWELNLFFCCGRNAHQAKFGSKQKGPAEQVARRASSLKICRF